MIALLLQTHATYAALTNNTPVPPIRPERRCEFENQVVTIRDPWRRLATTMFEHPAVSSVSWDVVFCLLSSIAWAAINDFDAKRMLGTKSFMVRKEVQKDE